MQLLSALIAGLLALAGVGLQACIQARREAASNKQNRERELFKLEFEKFKELEELLSDLVRMSQYDGRNTEIEERFNKLRHRLSLGFPNYDELGKDLDEAWEAFSTVRGSEEKFIEIKSLSHSIIKSCRTALMADFPKPPNSADESFLKKLWIRFGPIFLPALYARVSSPPEKE